MVGFSQLVRKSDMIMDCDRGLSYKEEFPDKCSVANNLSELPPGGMIFNSLSCAILCFAFCVN